MGHIADWFGAGLLEPRQHQLVGKEKNQGKWNPGLHPQKLSSCVVLYIHWDQTSLDESDFCQLS